MIQAFFWLAFSLSLGLNIGLLLRSRQWRAYHKAKVRKQSTEVKDAIQAAWNAGLNPDRCTFARDGKVIYVGKNVSERTKAEINRPPPVVVRNVRPGSAA